ncbi:MAG: hypothetical protein Q8Q73_00050 [Stagnimonas sp.]|nr:hypothetical protein [Stagnimonas sp.]
MARHIAVHLALAVSGAMTVADASAVDNPCTVGAQVVDRKNQLGTVVAVDGTSCKVRLANGSEDYYLGWMLKSASEPAAQPAGLAVGPYRCVAGGGSAGGFDLVVGPEGTYSSAGSSGEFRLDQGSGKLVFPTGSLKGMFGKVLGEGKLGLSSRDGGYSGTVCNAKRK